MKTVAVLLLASVTLGGCATTGGQERADALLAGLENFTATGKPHKDEFVRQYGIPTGCTSLATGELCEWRLDTGSSGGAYSSGQITLTGSDLNSQIIRVEFGKSAEFVKGRTVVRNGEEEYIGGDKNPHPSDWKNSCASGEIYSEGKCSALRPIGFNGGTHQ